MLVSVISAVYNCEKYVGEMIDSILGQSYTNWELIIVDDASTDNTWEIISAYTDNRIKIFHNEINRGLTVSLNKAWSIAGGDYLVRIDGDDIAYEGRLDRQLHFMINHPEVIVLGGGMNLFGTVNEIEEPICSAEINRIMLMFNAVIGHPTMMIRKKVLDDLGIKYNEKLRYAQDYYFEYLVSKFGEVSAIPECVIKYRVHERQITQKKLSEQIKCADYTRREVLKDLNIFLTNEEFDIWRAFCLGDLGTCKQNVEVIENVSSRIILNNEKYNVYDQKLLVSVINNKVKSVHDYNICNAKFFDDAKYRYMFKIQSRWMYNRKNGKMISNWLKKKRVRTLVIYGMGIMGRHLLDEIHQGDLILCGLVDRDAVGEFEGVGIINPDAEIPYADAMIITVIYKNEEIMHDMSLKFQGNIYSIDDIVHEVALM